MTSESDRARAGEASVPLRNEPIQARSAARLAALLDAAALVIDEIGFERLTTAMVAERAGSSIGTVYRYFPDRIAVLQQLASRSLSRFESEGMSRLTAVEPPSPWSVIDVLLEYWIDAYRTETGFRSMRFGDVIDLYPRPGGRTNIGRVSGTVATLLVERHGLQVDAPGVHLEVALVILDAVLARAFAFHRDGDDALVLEAEQAARSYLERTWGSIPAS